MWLGKSLTELTTSEVLTLVSSVEGFTDKIFSFDDEALVSTMNTFFREVSLELYFEVFGFSF